MYKLLSFILVLFFIKKIENWRIDKLERSLEKERNEIIENNQATREDLIRLQILNLYLEKIKENRSNFGKSIFLTHYNFEVMTNNRLYMSNLLHVLLCLYNENSTLCEKLIL